MPFRRFHRAIDISGPGFGDVPDRRIVMRVERRDRSAFEGVDEIPPYPVEF